MREFASLGFLPKAGIARQDELEGPLTRGQYVALWVEANNALTKPITGVARQLSDVLAKGAVDVLGL